MAQNNSTRLGRTAYRLYYGPEAYDEISECEWLEDALNKAKLKMMPTSAKFRSSGSYNQIIWVNVSQGAIERAWRDVQGEVAA